MSGEVERSNNVLKIMEMDKKRMKKDTKKRIQSSRVSDRGRGKGEIKRQ